MCQRTINAEKVARARSHGWSQQQFRERISYRVIVIYFNGLNRGRPEGKVKLCPSPHRDINVMIPGRGGRLIANFRK
jgi:hypothetical protein